MEMCNYSTNVEVILGNNYLSEVVENWGGCLSSYNINFLP